jgi:hypothetical protein
VSNKLFIGMMATAVAAMVSSAASAGSARIDTLANAKAKLLPPADIVMSLLAVGLAPDTEPVLRGPYYVLHAIKPWGGEVRVVADARFGDILSVLPVYPWTAYARYGSVARIINVPANIYGDRKSPEQRGDIAPSTPRGHVQEARDDETPVYPQPDVGAKADSGEKLD